LGFHEGCASDLGFNPYLDYAQLFKMLHIDEGKAEATTLAIELGADALMAKAGFWVSWYLYARVFQPAEE